MRNQDGINTLEPDCIETFTGRWFNVVNPVVDAVHIQGVAHGLSMICRYGGQCRVFYSVAEHSVYVSKALDHFNDPVLSLAGLLHDGSEAYVGDVTRPLKKELEKYATIERLVQGCINRKFDIPVTADKFKDLIKLADNAMLKQEVTTLLPSQGKEFVHSILDYVPVSTPVGWTPDEAKERFLSRFHELQRKR
jgi:hypothetical protein